MKGYTIQSLSLPSLSNCHPKDAFYDSPAHPLLYQHWDLASCYSHCYCSHGMNQQLLTIETAMLNTILVNGVSD